MEKNACQQSAALVAQKQEAAASALLREFVTKYPDRCHARQAYGDLLLQMRQVPEARIQFEEQLEHCQDDRPDRDKLMLYAHSQLAEIASGTRDTYAERLHRGIGYYLLARKFKEVGIGGTTITSKSLLEKAQSELTQAIEIRPDDAKPCWYLSGVYREQGQIASADRFVRQAGQLASQSRLTQQERRGLELALRSLRSS
jgi:tetratricopeptide (TPR) repeat protein